MTSLLALGAERRADRSCPWCKYSRGALGAERLSTPGVRWQSGEVRPGDAALSTALSLGIDVAVNVITEFAGSP